MINSREYLSGEHGEDGQYRLARFLIETSKRLCLIDVESLHYYIRKKLPICQNKVGARKSISFSRDGGGRGVAREASAKKFIWALLMMLLYIYTSLKLLMNTYFLTMRHTYSIEVLKLEQPRGSSKPTSSAEALSSSVELASAEKIWKLNSSCGTQLELAKHNLAAVEGWLDWLGSPYRELGIFTAVGYLILTGLAFTTYAIPQIYFRYIATAKFFLVDLMLDEQAEYRHCQRLVRDEVANLTLSSSNTILFIQESIFDICDRLDRLCENSDGLLRRHLEAGQKIVDQQAIGKRARLVRQTIGEHERLARQAKLLHAANRLMPWNRSAERVSKLVLDFNKFIIGNTIYSYMFDLFIGYGAPAWIANVRLHLKANDIWALVEIFVLAQISIFTTNYWVALMTSHSTDQTEYVNHLGGEIVAHVRANARHFQELLHFVGPTSLGCGSKWTRKQRELMIDFHTDRLNSNLVECLLKYRILMAQVRPIILSWRMIILGALNMFVGLPITMRLYAPYLVADFKLLGLLCSMTFIVYADIMLFPICHFHSKGNQLYKRLSSLLAHTTAIDQMASERLGRNLFAPGAVSILRKEMSHPEVVSKQFITSMFGIDATFPNMVEFHFYHGLVMISLFTHLDSWQLLLGDRLNDPLGLL